MGLVLVNCEEAIDVVTMDESENEEMRGCDEGSSPVVSWDLSNPLRILLVEADDSTRHIIGALLRKYNFKDYVDVSSCLKKLNCLLVDFEIQDIGALVPTDMHHSLYILNLCETVLNISCQLSMSKDNVNKLAASVSDGLKAWDVLKAKNNSMDLVLTEVELPSISGYALLALFTEHEFCKNIPFIRIVLLKFKEKVIKKNPFGVLSSWKDGTKFCSSFGIECVGGHMVSL